MTAAATPRDDARARFPSAQSVLLVDWLGPATPRTIAKLAPVTYGKVGPAEDDWALIEPEDGGDGFRATKCARPEHADLLHLDWTLGFDEFVDVASDLGVKTFWYHSGGRARPLPLTTEGCGCRRANQHDNAPRSRRWAWRTSTTTSSSTWLQRSTVRRSQAPPLLVPGGEQQLGGVADRERTAVRVDHIADV